MSIARTLSKGAKRLKKAFGKGETDTGVAGSTLDEKKASFNREYLIAQNRVNALTSLPGVNRNDNVKGLMLTANNRLKSTRALVDNATKPEQIDAEADRLKEIEGLAKQIIEAAKPPENWSDFEKALATAKNSVGEMRAMPAGNEAFIVGHIAIANETINKATAAANSATTKEEVQKQIDLLQGVENNKKDAAGFSKREAATKPKNLEEFEKKRIAANNLITEVSKLPNVGTDGAEAAELLGQATKIVETATADARAATKEQVVADSIDMLKNIDSLIDEAKAKGKAAQERNKTDFSSLPKWKKLLDGAEQARSEMIETDASPTQYKKLVDLISTAKLINESEGTEKAIVELEKYPAIVAASKDLQNLLAEPVTNPLVVRELAAVRTELEELAKVAPAYTVTMHRQDMDNLVAQSRDDGEKAIGDLQKLQGVVHNDVTRWTGLEKAVREKLGQYNAESQRLTGAGFKPSAFALPSQMVKLVENTDLPARDWERADTRLGTALKDLGSLRDEQEATMKRWTSPRSVKQRAGFYALAKSLYHWPPLSGAASRLSNSLKGLEEELAATGDYAACLARYDSLGIEAAAAALEAARDADPLLPKDEGGLNDFHQKMLVAQQEFAVTEEMVITVLDGLEATTNDVADPASSKFRRDLETARREWGAFQNQPTDLSPRQAVVPFIERLNAIKKQANELLANPDKLAAHREEARLNDAKSPVGRLQATIGNLLQQLEKQNRPVPQLRQRFNTLLLPSTSADDRAKGMVDLYEDLRGLETQLKNATIKRGQELGNSLNGINSSLKNFKGKGFEGYQEILTNQSTDLRAMAASGDPYYLEKAEQAAQQLKGWALAVDGRVPSDERGKNVVPYKDVVELFRTLSFELGGDMLEYLPTTTARLRADLTETLGEIRKLPPQDAMARLKDFEVRVEDARSRTRTAKVQKADFKLRKARLEKQWERLKHNARDGIFEFKPKDFSKYFDARLAEADSMVKEENGPERANAALAKLETTLGSVEVSADPRVELQKLDTQVAQEQETILQMTRTFEAELDYFKKTTIPRARKLIEAREAEDKSLLERGADAVKGAAKAVAGRVVRGLAADSNADLSLLKNLETTADNAARPVEPYIKMASALPRIGSAKTPELSQAKTAFQTAYNMLATASRTVDTLEKSVTGTTTMEVTGDLKKIEANWIAQAQAYTKAVQAISLNIRSAAGDEADSAAAGTATAVATAVAGIANDFQPGAFASDIAIMTKETAKESDVLAARERILTSMRGFRNILNNHVLHSGLCAENNPFDGGNELRAARRGVLVALRRIELETLIGV